MNEIRLKKKKKRNVEFHFSHLKINKNTSKGIIIK